METCKELEKGSSVNNIPQDMINNIFRGMLSKTSLPREIPGEHCEPLRPHSTANKGISGVIKALRY
jgi:hypothetical protein